MNNSPFEALSILIPAEEVRTKPEAKAKTRSIYDKAQTGDLPSFEQWLLHGKAGSAFHYATATWLDQRVANKSHEYILPESTRRLAKRVMHCWENGLLELCQRPNDQGTYDYFAVKRAVIAPPIKPSSHRGDIR